MNKKEKELLEIQESFKDIIENEIRKSNTKNRNIEINDITLVGQAVWKDKINGDPIFENIFIVEKQIREIDENGRERVTEQKSCYLGNKCIGGTIGDNDIIFNSSFKNFEPDKVNDVKQLLDRALGKDIQANSMNMLKKEELADVLSASLGRKVSREEVDKLVDKKEKDDIENLEDEKDLSRQQADKIKVNGIQKANLNKLVDGKETLGKRLDLEEYDSIYIVYSENVKDITGDSDINTTTYSLVGMKKDGQARVLDDEFEMDKTVGNNANKEQTKIRANGTATRDNKDLSVYTRKSNGMSIGCENDKGNVQMFLYQKTFEENENVGLQIETSNTPVISIETREIMNRNKGVYQKDKVQDEVEEHTEAGCVVEDVKDFDGLEDTQTHLHFLDAELDDYVIDILNYENNYGEKKIKEVFTDSEVKDKLVRELEENSNKLTLQQIIENVKEEMNRDAEFLEREHKL